MSTDIPRKSFVDEPSTLETLLYQLMILKLAEKGLNIAADLSTMSAPIRVLGDTLYCWFCLEEIDTKSRVDDHETACPWRRAKEFAEELRRFKDDKKDQ